MVSGPVAVAVACPGIGQNNCEPQTGFVNDNQSLNHTLPTKIPRVNPEKDTRPATSFLKKSRFYLFYMLQ